MQICCCLSVVIGLAVFYVGFCAVLWPQETMDTFKIITRPEDIPRVVNAGMVATIVGGMVILSNLLLLISSKR
jgi:hypothetical protein